MIDGSANQVALFAALAALLTAICGAGLAVYVGLMVGFGLRKQDLRGPAS